MRHYSLLVFCGAAGAAGVEPVGEYSYHVRPEAAGKAGAELEPLRKLRAGLAGVVLGEGGVVAHSAELDPGHPWWRAGAVHVKREG